MLRIVYGPSGSGKTAYLIERIKEDVERGARSYLLIPEQQAYISERDLPAALPQNAGLFFEIVNFSSLAEIVFRKYGGITHATVGNGMRSLLMWDTLRELAPMLKQYGQSARGDATFPSMMLSTVSELHANNITAEQLEEAASRIESGSSLQKKLSDLSLIEAVYHQKTTDVFGEDPADKLLRLSSTLKKHRFFEGCHLYLDSFAGFTAQEFSVIREILGQAKCVTVALCTDSPISKLPQFSGITETARRLVELAKREHIAYESVMFSLENTTDEKPLPLKILERDLWRFNAKKQGCTAIGEDKKAVVRLTECANLYEEAEAAAWSILELVQSGMCFGDIAIVVRDMENYRGVLDAALERHHIPYFLSERTELSSKPLSRLLLSALRAASHNYQAKDIMALIKTGLSGADLRDAALFEEYCETWHINGSRFTDAVWNMNPDGLTTDRSARADDILSAANRVRRTVMDPLLSLSAALRASDTVLDRCRALYDYMGRLGLSQILSERAKKELLTDQMRSAGETVRLYRLVTETLTELCRVLPDAKMSVDEFISALTLLFNDGDLGSVPNTNDCVIIGSADSLRVENIRASLLLGLCEGEFPRAISDDGLLTEGDKTRLEEFGITFDSREASRACEEMLYAYRAISKPRERLYLFTNAALPDGSARTPSLVFSRVSYLLNLEKESFDSDAVRAYVHPTEDESDVSPLQIPPMESGTLLRLSQSKIQAFMLCPYRYYSTYFLKLREKKSATPTYADDGVFLHYVFEHFLRTSLTPGGTLALPPIEETEALADRIINDYLSCVCPIDPQNADKRLLHLFSRLRKLALLMLGQITDELRASQFIPTQFERVIGNADEGGLPSPKLILSDGSRVILNGKIDRIDLYREGKTVYVRVVDYKSGSRSRFSIEDVRSGMDIQLVLYLYAILAADPDMRAAGAQYLYAKSEKGHVDISRSGFLLDEPSVKAAADGTAESLYTKKLTALSTEQINALAEDMKGAVLSVAERILSGEAQKTPSQDACSLCPIRSNCDRAYHD